MKFNNKKGFTLAELLVVLGITVILFGIGMVALLHYSNMLKLTEMDNSAKELFISAQNHLTQAKASGQLTNVTSDQLGTKLDTKPSDMTSEDWTEDSENMYYISFSKGNEDELSSSILKNMLPYGAIDDNIRSDGYYVIEYNVVTATVYGVFYTDSKGGLGESYFNDGVRENNDTGKSDRIHYKGSAADYHVIGYYGGGMVKLLGADITKPALTVNNGNKLTVTITDPNYYTTVSDNTGANSDEVQLKTNITLTVTGKESHNSKTFVLGTTAAGATVSPADTNEKFWSVKKTEVGTAKYALTYNVNLDDITTEGCHFSELCSNLIPGEDIIVSASCSSNDVLTQVVDSNEGYTNSLFAKVDVDMNGSAYKGTATAEISNTRHLENLEPRISDLPSTVKTVPSATADITSTTVKNQYIINNVIQTKNIYFNKASSSDENCDKGFTEDIEALNGSDTFSIYGNKNNDDYAVDTSRYSVLATDGNYYGICNNNIDTFDGNNNIIEDITSDSSAITSESKTNKYGDLDAGLFRISSNNITFKNMVLKNFKCTSYKQCGALIGECNIPNTTNTNGRPSTITVTNVAVVGGTMKTVSTGSGASTSSSGNLGGMIGYIHTLNSATIDNCSASAVCSSTSGGNVGGMIGQVNATTTTITNCYTGGRTNGKGEYSTTDYNLSTNYISSRYVGGLAGSISAGSGTATIKECYSTCSVDGYNAGGFVGSILNKANLTDCYSTGLVKGTNKGCFAYKIGNLQTATGVYYLSGINDTSLKSIYSGSDTKVTATTYSGAIADANSETTTETNNYDSSLDGESYPFYMVNNAGATKTTSKKTHYGDWPESDKIDTSGANLFAYRETASDGTYHWHIMSANLDDNDNIVFSTYDNLDTTKGSLVNSGSGCYGILTATATFPNNKFKGGSYFNTSTYDKVKIKGVTYYFWKLNSTYSSKKAVFQLPAWYFASSKSGRSIFVQFQCNPSFAASMDWYHENKNYDYNTWTFGTEDNPYQVRTEDQFTNMNSSICPYNRYSSDYNHFTQTSDISMKDSYTKPAIYDSFYGTYDGNGYSIKNYDLSVTSGNRAGLFAYTYVDSNLNDIDLSGNVSITESSSPDVYAGALVGYCRGNVNGCTSNVDTKVKVSNVTYMLNAGGMIGYATEDSTFDGDTAHGSVKVYDTECTVYGAQTSIGGFVGRCDSTDSVPEYHVSSCKTDASIDADVSTDANFQCSIGGFAGTGYLADISKSSTKSTISSTSDKNYIGGFIGYAAMSSSGYCNFLKDWSKTSISSTATSGIIGGFAGYVDYLNNYDNETYQNTISNCYASTDFKSNNGTMELFMGEDAVSKKIFNCHAVERDGNTLVNSNLDFHDGAVLDYTESDRCYQLSTKAGLQSNGVMYIDSLNDYKLAGSMTELSDSVWKDGTAGYPVLIDNPEW